MRGGAKDRALVILQDFEPALNIGGMIKTSLRCQTKISTLDLSRFRAAPIAHLGGLSFESQWAFPTER